MDLISGIISACSPANLLYAGVGALLGTLVGVLPGIGAVSTVAILFPFTQSLEPTGMIIMMAAIYYGAMYGGSTTAILMNVPGEVASVVTAMDGYAMTRQGRGGPALAISAIVSFLAGVAGTVLLALIGPSLARFALTFGPAEYLGLGLFSLTAIASLSGASLLKGVIVTVVGMLLVSVGIDPASSVARLTFGNVSLLQGFDIVPVLIGLFGVAEVLRSLEENMEMIVKKIGRLMPNWQELRAALGAGTRATLIGFPFGLLPGMSPAICSFLSYSVERRVSKHPETFGFGAVEGVASAEAANNASAMAHFVPLLSLGIPTGATMALILAAFTLYGIVPGPLLFIRHADLTWTLIGSFFVANCIMLVLNLPLVGLWVRLAQIPYTILAPTILALCVVGAYATRNSVFDIVCCMFFGILGWGMGKYGWPVAPMVLAYVLGPMIEKSARQVLAISPWLLFQRPIFWLFIGLGALAVWFSARLVSIQEST
jgi:putative tricarboxylic transport membrane protein